MTAYTDMDSLIELAEEAHSTDELIEIEQLAGLHDFLGADSWDQLRDILHRVDSPWIIFIDCLIDRWDVLSDD